MEINQFKDPLVNGALSAIIGVLITYGVAMIYPTSDLHWTLTAVGFASFFSGFFSNYDI